MIFNESTSFLEALFLSTFILFSVLAISLASYYYMPELQMPLLWLFLVVVVVFIAWTIYNKKAKVVTKKVTKKKKR